MALIGRTPQAAPERPAPAVTNRPPSPNVTPPNTGTPAPVPAPSPEPVKTADTITATPELSVDFLASPITLAPDLVKATAPAHERSEQQKKIDEIVKNVHGQWKEAGKPSQWGKCVADKLVVTYFLLPAQVSEVKKLVNRATVLHEVRVKYGSEVTVTEALVKRYGLPADYLGRTVLSFTIMDKMAGRAISEETRAKMRAAAAARKAK